MKHVLLLLLALAVPAHCAPVHVSLRARAQSGPAANGFLVLSQIADLSGGTKSERARLAFVPVGRIPLSGDTRLLTPGDVSLKLRQAGFHPERDIVLEGAKQVSIVSVDAAAPALLAQPASVPVSALARRESSEGGHNEATPPPAIIIHRSDSVAIVVQQGDLTITAKGTAREAGAVGQTIRVHRDGALSDLTATVLDAQTVQLDL